MFPLPGPSGVRVKPEPTQIAVVFWQSGISQRGATTVSASTDSESFIVQGPFDLRGWEDVMEFPSCPYLARLGRELIDAYRRLDDLDTEPQFSTEILALHSLICKHRTTCQLCIQIESARKRVAVDTLRAMDTQTN
jgi:hypothetical protein